MRLHVMFNANPAVDCTHSVDRHFSILGRNRDQLATGKFLRRAALIHINVGGFGTYNSMKGLGERLQTEAIRRRAVEYKKDFCIFSEMVPEEPFCRLCIRIVSIADHVSLVRRGYRSKDMRVNSRVVVAGETARRLHGGNNL